MSNACPTSDLFIPDPDIGRLSKSIRSLYAAILERAVKDIFKPYVIVPMFVFGEGIEPEDYPFYQRKFPDFSKGEKFRIYWAGAPNPRKGYHYALELLKYFVDEPRVEMYIKTTMTLLK